MLRLVRVSLVLACIFSGCGRSHGTAATEAGAPDLQPLDLAASPDARPDLALPDALPPDGTSPDAPIPDLASPDTALQVPGVWVPLKAGTFAMGAHPGRISWCTYSDEIQHQVKLAHKFDIQRAEVTQHQFNNVMGYNPASFTSCGGTCPVESVTWHQAAAYCDGLSARVGLTACYACSGSGATVTCAPAAAFSGAKIYTCPGFRLPTEAEWEYAYRAGTVTSFYNGESPSCPSKDPLADKIAWYYYNSSQKPHPVRTKAPNAWGLYDMAGNVREWCHDGYTGYPTSPVTNPCGPAPPATRVIRGGSWNSVGIELRAANRKYPAITYKSNTLGLRCVRTR